MLEASPAEAGPTEKVRDRSRTGSGERRPPYQAKNSGSGFLLQLPRVGSGSGSGERAPAPGFPCGSRCRVLAEEAPAPAVGRAGIRCRVLAGAGWGSCRSWAVKCRGRGASFLRPGRCMMEAAWPPTSP